METSDSYSKELLTGSDPSGYSVETTVAAVFADRERAHDAVHRLHDEGFRDTWIGLTRTDEANDYTAAGTATGETRVEAENWFTRFFGEGDESLRDALTRHGVAEADALAAGALPANSAIITVDGANHPELAAQVISECGGRLITRGFGATGFGTTGMYGSTGVDDAPTARTTSLIDDGASADVAPIGTVPLGVTPLVGTPDAGIPPSADASGYDDYGRYRAGAPVDESTRLQLREERLRVDKSRISRGEATIGTEVVTETHNIDVPLIREELFIERRPVTGSAVIDAAPIGAERDVIRVPLSQEQVTITKTPVVTEEVVIGKREVEETQHVSETTRKEQLNVTDVDATVSTGAGRDTRF